VSVAAVGVWIGVGSRDETAAQAGAAHYLEHLLFKGTPRRNATQIAQEIDAVGGELNAFTAKEHTCFYAHVLDAEPAARGGTCSPMWSRRLDDRPTSSWNARWCSKRSPCVPTTRDLLARSSTPRCSVSTRWPPGYRLGGIHPSSGMPLPESAQPCPVIAGWIPPSR